MSTSFGRAAAHRTWIRQGYLIGGIACRTLQVWLAELPPPPSFGSRIAGDVLDMMCWFGSIVFIVAWCREMEKPLWR